VAVVGDLAQSNSVEIHLKHILFYFCSAETLGK